MLSVIRAFARQQCDLMLAVNEIEAVFTDKLLS